MTVKSDDTNLLPIAFKVTGAPMPTKVGLQVEQMASQEPI